MSKVDQMSVNEVFEIYEDKNNDYVFIDVREPNEWEAGVIPGVQKISLGDIPDKLDSLDKDKKYIMVCRSGGRSNAASSMMIEKGFNNVSNFQGGMLDWYDSGFPTE